MERIRTDMTTAMKAKDALTLRSLRAVIAAVQQEETSGSKSTLDDVGVVKVIKSQVKRRVEAAEAFDAGDRPEKAAAERDEIEILEVYLPASLTEAELPALVDEILAAEGLTEASQFGAAMKAVTQRVAGRADNKLVAQLVKSRLS